MLILDGEFMTFLNTNKTDKIIVKNFNGFFPNTTATFIKINLCSNTKRDNINFDGFRFWKWLFKVFTINSKYGPYYMVHTIDSYLG